MSYFCNSLSYSRKHICCLFEKETQNFASFTINRNIPLFFLPFLSFFFFFSFEVKFLFETKIDLYPEQTPFFNDLFDLLL